MTHIGSMPMSLLIVDDSELIRASLKNLLAQISDVGSLFTAGSLAAGMLVVKLQRPHFTILDLHLPDGHALSMISPMQSLAPQMHIAVLTNDASALNRKRCRDAGIRWFFDKSTEFEKLLDVVKHQAQLHSTGSR